MSSFRKSRTGWRSFFLLGFMLVFSVTGLQAKKGRFVTVNPLDEKGVLLSVNGKEQTYFQLGKSGEMKLSLEGPGTLKVFSRLNFTPDLKGPHKYALEIKEGDKILKTHSTTADRSNSAYKNLELIPGKSRKFTLDVPKGFHTYRFSLKEGTPASVSLRFAYNSDADAGKLASLTPLSYSRVASALIKEKLVSYFVATPEIKVKLRIIGPTKLRIVSRLNYDYQMKGEQKYALQVAENEKLILTKPLQTSKSVGVEYKDWKEVVPGKSQTFYLDVPAGEHNYGFKLTESIAQSVSLRFSIPEGSLANEE